MLIAAVGDRGFAGGQPAAQMSPVIRSGVRWIDGECFNGVDRLEHALDLRPAHNLEQ